MGAIFAFSIAFLAEGLGVAIGIILLYIFKIQDKRIMGMLFGATSGIMIALICFDVLPNALSLNQNLFVFFGVTLGIGIGLSLNKVTYLIEKGLHINGNKNMQTGMALLMGIAIHNIPEGFAIGALANGSIETITNFAIIVCLHSIPEAIAIAIPLKEAGVRKRFLLQIPIVLGAVMGVGAIGGYVLSQITTSFIAISLGLTAGIILYIVCDELVPEARHIWNGRMTSVATVFGILAGMMMMV
ncbi:MAG: zinc permease [Epulopiscium sp. Nele67-Bin005]|nr:MAG: zinc permease [Epulopiscium sp. Nele67-Bin005]